MGKLWRLAGRVIGLCLLVGGAQLAHADDADANALLAEGVSQRAIGRLDVAIDTFTQALQLAQSSAVRARAEGELGATLFQEHRYAEARTHLLAAYQGLSPPARAVYAIDLGNLALVEHARDDARRYYDEGTSAADARVRISARLNLARMTEGTARIPMLEALSAEIARLPGARDRALYELNLGDQASGLGNSGLAIAYAHLTLARRLADQSGDMRLAVESRAALARLYEDHQRYDDALVLTREALARAHQAASGAVADLLIELDWREARLLHRRGDDELAIAAYRRTVESIQTIRQDIPIAYEDGRSSFSTTLEPIYLGLADLLLQRTSQRTAAGQDTDLRGVKEVLELLKQAEMQDYLGDRCTVEALQGGNAVPAAGTAFLYPVLLPDRTELLLETGTGIVRATAPVGQERIEQVVRQFAESLRNDAPDYQIPGRQLYDWLIAPLRAVLETQGVHTLVVVSDGALRLIPIEALYDGHEFMVERFAIATVTGLTMTNATPPQPGRPTALIAGLSLPGPVVSRLRSITITAPPEQNSSTARAAPASVRALRVPPATTRDDPVQQEAERVSLALPGVLDEVQSLTTTLHGVSLLNAQFTDARFRGEAGSGDYRIVHIASHGYFGGSAQDSFILTYDELLTLGDLQSLLQSREYSETPIELLSLSACETAEGNERSPLGISGAAMKARAKSVLGTLWPVDDQAARAVMEQFYSGLESRTVSKAEALRAAQLDLLHGATTAHPFYWAPFVLIGNWL